MRDPLLDWHPVWDSASVVYGYQVMGQTRGKLQRYAIYETSPGDGLTYTRIARDLKHDAALSMLKILLACASNH